MQTIGNIRFSQRSALQIRVNPELRFEIGKTPNRVELSLFQSKKCNFILNKSINFSTNMILINLFSTKTTLIQGYKAGKSLKISSQTATNDSLKN